MVNLRRERLMAVFFAACLALPGTAQNLRKRVSLNLQNARLTEFFQQVKSQTGLNFIFQSKVGENPSVTLESKDKPVKDVLDEVMRKINCTYTVEDNMVTIVPLRGTYRMLSGKVTDNTGKPLPGVNVFIRNTKFRTITNQDGDYHLSIPLTRQKVSFTYVGMKEAVHTVEQGAAPIEKNITLDDGKMLKDVVVTGIFNKPKASFTGAATVITKDEIAAQGNRNLLKTISNIDPSFDIQENNMSGSDPNKQLSIEIRGKSSLAANISNMNEVQDNVRNEYNLPLFILDGFEVTSERVMDMNQADVESIVILKDASATAIYGSRGANGVVVITSVKPTMGRVRVNYSVGMNLEIPDLSSYNLMNSFEKLDAEQQAGLYTAKDLSTQLQYDAMYNANYKAAKEGVNTDWAHMPLRTGIGQYHNLTLGGGTSDFRYNLHFAYNQLNGTMKGSDRNNMNGGVQISYFLKKVNFTNDLSIGLNHANESTYGQYSDWVRMNPYWRAYDTTTGNPVQSYTVPGYNYPVYSPLYDAMQTSFNKSEYLNIRNTLNMMVNITEGLRLDLSLGVSQQRKTGDSFLSPKSSTSQSGSYDKADITTSAYQVSGTLSWAKVIGKHSLYLGANYQLMQNKSNDFSVRVTGFSNDQMNDISMGSKYFGDKPSATEVVTRSMGFTGTLNYNFDSRYFIDGSYRVDGASSFGPESRWAPFWSVGLGWELTKEKWLSFLKPVINYAKVRYSYGVTSSLSFSPYDAFTTYKYNIDATAGNINSTYNGLIGATIYAYGNPELKWQNTKQHNLGIDISFFNNFMTLSANYYKKLTDNLITDAYLPVSHGYTSYKANLGSVKNVGWDLSLNFNVLRIQDKDITWAVRFSTYSNKNILLKLSDTIKKLMASPTASTNRTYYMYREGYSMDELYVAKSAGVDPLTGNRLYIGENGELTYNPLNQVAVGSTQPKLNGRIGTSFRWKGLLVDIGFGLRLGAKKLNGTLLTRVENADIKFNADKRVTSARWKKPGDISAYKALNSSQASYASDAFVFTENTLTFNSLNITYDFPKAVVKFLRLQRLSLTGSITDLAYWSNIEQERGTSYPYTIKPTFSLACTF